MMKNLHALVAAVLLALSGSVCAKNVALILWIGDYGAQSLPGIDLDARMARKIAASMGVSEENITEVANRQLTLSGLAGALGNFESKVAQGDKVFIYYSGHGTQIAGEGGSQCTEGMVAADFQYYKDYDLQAYLENLSRKASQVVMMNDSCFSGGQATKSLREASYGNAVPKFMPPALVKSGNANDNYVCNKPVNDTTKSLGKRMKSYGKNFVYIAASSEREVSFATPSGSAATLSWYQCLANAADLDHSGSLSADEIARCAQDSLRRDAPNRRQTITIIGNGSLPLSFALENTVVATSPASMLNDLRSAASPSIPVDLQVASTQLRIKQPGRPGDRLRFNVTTRSSGYLYLLYSSTDQQNIDVLFPNARDKDNYVQPGNYALPRPTWGIEAGGPAGAGHLLAIVSPQPMDFASGDGEAGSFKTNSRSARKLLLTGPQGGTNYGASQVVTINEIN